MIDLWRLPFARMRAPPDDLAGQANHPTLALLCSIRLTTCHYDQHLTLSFTMLPGYLLSAVSLCSAALLTTATDAGVAHLEARDNTMHDVVHAGLVERDLAERAPDPCPAGNCPCTSGQCPRPRPHGKSKNPDKIYRGIDFSRQNSQTFVRFILASSMRVGSVPLVIDTKEVRPDFMYGLLPSVTNTDTQCLDNITAGYPLNDPEAVDAVYNRKPLRRYHLRHSIVYYYGS